MSIASQWAAEIVSGVSTIIGDETFLQYSKIFLGNEQSLVSFKNRNDQYVEYNKF